MKAFRADLRCSGKLMKSQLCSAERENWLKQVTVQRALRVRRQQHACNQRKVVPEIRVGVLNVQGMSWAKRSYRGMLWHIVMKMPEQNADVMFLSDLSTPEWMSEGNKVVMLGLEEYTLFVNGVVGIVLSRLFVKLWHHSGSTVYTAGNKRWIGLTVRIGVLAVSSRISQHANAEWRECAWTEARAQTWNRAAGEVETKRRPRDPGRRCELPPGSRGETERFCG